MGIYEILGIAILIIGVVLVAQEDSLDNTAKILWILAILFFNILGLIAFLIWRAMK